MVSMFVPADDGNNMLDDMYDRDMDADFGDKSGTSLDEIHDLLFLSEKSVPE